MSFSFFFFLFLPKRYLRQGQKKKTKWNKKILNITLFGRNKEPEAKSEAIIIITVENQPIGNDYY